MPTGDRVSSFLLTLTETLCRCVVASALAHTGRFGPKKKARNGVTRAFRARAIQNCKKSCAVDRMVISPDAGKLACIGPVATQAPQRSDVAAQRGRHQFYEGSCDDVVPNCDCVSGSNQMRLFIPSALKTASAGGGRHVRRLPADHGEPTTYRNAWRCRSRTSGPWRRTPADQQNRRVFR
jgi:hypothetical protein